MRYLSNSARDRAEMLEATGRQTIEELFTQIPEALRLKGKLNLPGPLSEAEILAFFREAARQSSREYNSFLGAGAYAHYAPVAMDGLLQRGEFFTAYTPYQAEIAQGTLQAMFEFQTLIAQLTGMEVANASLYDGSTATTEAILMALRATRRTKVLLARTLHPEYRDVFATYARHQDLERIEIPYTSSGQLDLAAVEAKLDNNTAAVVVQSPNFFGALERIEAVAELAHSAGALLIVTVTEPLSLAIVKPPTDADIVCGEAQSFGVSPSFGGPYLGFLAAKEKLLRQMPGRLVGETVDREGRRGYVLTLAAREQHIRREKATSNICTNQSLCALAATIYLSLMGKNGLRALAEDNFSRAAYAQAQLAAIPGFNSPFGAPHFNEFVVKTPGDSSGLLRQLAEEKIIGGFALERFYPELKGCLLVCTTEAASRQAIDRHAEVCRRYGAKNRGGSESRELESQAAGRQ